MWINVNSPQQKFRACRVREHMVFGMWREVDDAEYRQIQADAFQEVCQPVVDYLNKKHHPHTSIVITQTSAKVVENVLVYLLDDWVFV